MLKNFSNRFLPALFLFLLPLLISGCANGFFSGLFGFGGATESERSKESMQQASDAWAETTNADKAHAEHSQPVDRSLARIIDIHNPEELTPLSTPKRTEQREGVNRATAGRKEGFGKSVFSYKGSVLTEDTTWHGEVLIEGGVTVAQQATLTIESGTMVRFRGLKGADASRSSLVVLGRFVVKGTPARPVIFSSVNDDEWRGIIFTGSQKRNLIEYARIEGAATGVDASFSNIEMKDVVFSGCRTGARLQDTVTAVSGLVFGECGSGMIIYNSEADLRSSSFFGNRMGLYASRTSLSLTGSGFTGNNLLALAADGCRMDVRGNTFSANGSGIVVTGGEGSLSGNRIANNAAYGIVLKGARVKINANEISGNARVGIRAEDGQGVAWGNSIYSNSEFDMYNGGADEFRAIGNWWGSDATTAISKRIYDRSVDEKSGRVLFVPPLAMRPDLDIPRPPK